MLNKLRDAGIENIVIFVSDAHRFDYLPKEIRDMGITFKMVAASTFTAPSLSSICLGIFSFRHKVKSFRDKIPTDYISLFDIDGMNTTFNTENTWINWDFTDTPPIFKMLRRNERISLKDLKAPFVYIEDEKGGHCPYGWDENDVYEEWECKRFFHDHGKKPVKELRDRYSKGIARSMKEFKKRIAVLKKRGLLEKTLIIFVSDHGELLGEYGGIIGHGTVTTPEIIYVPCVFIHPSLKGGKSFEKKGLLSHVDILPTILDLLGKKVDQEFDGNSILEMKKLPGKRFSYFEHDIKKRTFLGEFIFNMKERAIWGIDGGIVFRENSNFFKSHTRALYESIVGQSILAQYTRSRFNKNPIRGISNLVRMMSEFSRKLSIYGKFEGSTEKSRELIGLIEKRNIRPADKATIRKKISKIGSLKINGSRKV